MEFEVTKVNIVYTALGGFVVCLSLVSCSLTNKLYMSEVTLALIFGLTIGPHGLEVFDPRRWTAHGTYQTDDTLDTNYATFELMRIALGIGLFAIGVELPKSYLRDHARCLAVLVIPVMAWGWVVSAGVICWIFPALGYVPSLLVAACLTPTDPVLANAIVSGRWAEKNVPERLRHLLAAESAANDGLAYPFLYISLKMVTEGTRANDVVRFIWQSVVYQVLFGVATGTLIGWLFRLTLRHANKHGFADRSSYLIQYLALTILSLGATSLLGGDDLLAAFAAGSAISWDGDFNEKAHSSEFSSVVEMFFNCACFIYIGAWLPFDALEPNVDQRLGVTADKLAVLFVILLIVRRMPVLIALWYTGWLAPDIKSLSEALFSGHFGPMGVGAVFICMFAVTKLPAPRGDLGDPVDRVASSIQPIVSFVVFGSIFVHGLSIPLFSVGSWLYLKVVRSTYRVDHPQQTGYVARFESQPVLPDERRGLLDGHSVEGYSVGTCGGFGPRCGIDAESHA